MRLGERRARLAPRVAGCNRTRTSPVAHSALEACLYVAFGLAVGGHRHVVSVYREPTVRSRNPLSRHGFERLKTFHAGVLPGQPMPQPGGLESNLHNAVSSPCPRRYPPIAARRAQRPRAAASRGAPTSGVVGSIVGAARDPTRVPERNAAAGCRDESPCEGEASASRQATPLPGRAGGVGATNRHPPQPTPRYWRFPPLLTVPVTRAYAGSGGVTAGPVAQG